MATGFISRLFKNGSGPQVVIPAQTPLTAAQNAKVKQLIKAEIDALTAGGMLACDVAKAAKASLAELDPPIFITMRRLRARTDKVYRADYYKAPVVEELEPAAEPVPK